jgi:hypothetical protein
MPQRRRLRTAAAKNPNVFLVPFAPEHRCRTIDDDRYPLSPRGEDQRCLVPLDGFYERMYGMAARRG